MAHVATRSIQRINDGQLLGRKNWQLSQVVRDTEKYDFYWLKPLQSLSRTSRVSVHTSILT